MSDAIAVFSSHRIVQFATALTQARVTFADGGVYLTQLIDGAEGAAQVFIPDEEIGALLTTLQQHLTRRSEAVDVPAPDDMRIWRVIGTILHDDPDGEERATAVDVTVAADDSYEALRVTLEQLQMRYAGATWETTPSVECQF